MAPHIVSRCAPASEPPTMARGSCQASARRAQSASFSPMGGRNPVRRSSATTTSSNASKGVTPRSRATSPTLRPSSALFSGAKVSSKIRRSHCARCRRMPASSDWAAGVEPSPRLGVGERRDPLIVREREDLAPPRQPVEDGAVREAQPDLHGVRQRQRDHRGAAVRGRRPRGQLAPGAVGVHGRHARARSSSRAGRPAGTWWP